VHDQRKEVVVEFVQVYFEGRQVDFEKKNFENKNSGLLSRVKIGRRKSDDLLKIVGCKLFKNSQRRRRNLFSKKM